MRKRSFSDAIDRFFKLGNNLNQRDVIAVRRTVSGLLKLLYPHGVFGKEEVRPCLTYALELRRRIKEQLKKLGMEFFDVHFSYLDNETLEEFFVNVPEQGGSQLIPEAWANRVVHMVTKGVTGQLGLYRFETQMTPGNGKHSTSGLGSNTPAKEAIRVGLIISRAI
jgi:ATP-dependent Lon protease